MNAPLISVVLPVHNGEKYIAEAVESIVCQSFRNFECIIIDDGSTDMTRQVLRKYESADSRIRLISRQKSGLVASLNTGIELARGEWIARMDADDISLPHRFERQLQWLEHTGADICGSWVKFFGTADRRILRHPQTNQAARMELLFDVPFAHPTVMMRTALVKELCCYKAVGKHNNIDLCEDYDLWERAARAGWKMTNVQEVLLMYRQHPNQISTSKATQQLFFSKVVRRRYFSFISDMMLLGQDWVDEVMKIGEPSLPKIDMDVVDSFFDNILRLNHGEARDTIFYYVTLYYYLLAADCPGVVARWSAFNKKFGVGFAFGIKLKLWLLRVLRIRSNSDAFHRLKKYYLTLFR